MARIRSIHPGIYTDEAWASVSITARWFATGLCTEADDNGVFEWKPVGLKMKIFPADSVDVGELLSEMVNAEIVMAFEADGKRYGAIRNFCRFQRPRKPKAWFPITDEARKFVALGAAGDAPSDDEEGVVPKKSELDSIEAPPVPQKSGMAQQMEDGRGSSNKPPLAPLAGGGEEICDEAGRRKPKRRIPVDLPSSDQIATAQAEARKAGANVDMAYQAQRFRNWAAAKDARYADWGRTWANWYLKAITEAPKRPVVVGVPRQAATADEIADMWDRRVAEFKRSRHWNPVDWEERPGRPGCKVPPEILAKHGYSQDQGEAA